MLNSASQYRTLAFAAGTAGLFLLVYFPALSILVGKWSQSEEYNHAFLVVPIIGYMIWVKRDKLAPVNSRVNVLGLAGLVISAAFYYFSLVTEVHTLIALSTYFSFVSILVFVIGFRPLKYILTPLLLLLLLIPIPDQLYVSLTFPLQLKVSEMSEIIIRLFDIPLLRQGNVMHIPDKSFEVVEACSGLRSIIALFTLSIIIGYFLLQNISSRLTLALISVPVAIVVNTLRVTIMILSYHFFHLDLADGPLHSAVGIGVFIVSMIILLAVQRGLEKWETRQIKS